MKTEIHLQAKGAFIQTKCDSHLVSILADFQVDGDAEDDAAAQLQRHTERDEGSITKSLE